VVGSALVEAVRSSLGADGKPSPATVASVAELVRALPDGVRGAQRASVASVG
jgi:tryptophan synthase alpha chain